jgi:acetylornithine aminotransferase/acetylornithine/N-succinyldiaminopimelate aminotransferase
LIRETRGLGLLCALDLNVDVDARALMVSLREAGLLVSIAGGSALRFSPPLVTTREQIDEAIAIVEAVLGGALA